MRAYALFLAVKPSERTRCKSVDTVSHRNRVRFHGSPTLHMLQALTTNNTDGTAPAIQVRVGYVAPAFGNHRVFG